MVFGLSVGALGCLRGGAGSGDAQSMLLSMDDAMISEISQVF